MNFGEGSWLKRIQRTICNYLLKMHLHVVCVHSMWYFAVVLHVISHRLWLTRDILSPSLSIVLFSLPAAWASTEKLSKSVTTSHHFFRIPFDGVGGGGFSICCASTGAVKLVPVSTIFSPFSRNGRRYFLRSERSILHCFDYILLLLCSVFFGRRYSTVPCAYIMTPTDDV